MWWNIIKAVNPDTGEPLKFLWKGPKAALTGTPQFVQNYIREFGYIPLQIYKKNFTGDYEPFVSFTSKSRDEYLEQMRKVMEGVDKRTQFKIYTFDN